MKKKERKVKEKFVCPKNFDLLAKSIGLGNYDSKISKL